jgi:NTE family protein
MVEKNGQPGLRIIASEKEYGPPIVRPLLYIDGADSNNATFSLGARITFMDVGGFGSEWRNDFLLGSQRGISSEFFHPFSPSLRWFVAPQLFAKETTLPFYSGDTFIAEYQDRQAGGEADLGYHFGRTGELRAGYQLAYRKTFPLVGNTNVLPSLEGRLGTTKLTYSLIDVDDAVIPRNGVNLNFRAQWFDTAPGATSGFPLVENQMTVFKRLDQPSSVLFSAYGGTTFDYHHVGVPVFSLGGPRTLAAYGTNELLTNQYFLFRAGYLRELARLPTLVGDKLYVYGAYEVAKPYGVAGAPSLPMDGVGAIVVNTFFGPILIGASAGDSGHHKFFFEIGRIF